MKSIYTKAIQELGLTENQVNVYLTCLQHGLLTAVQIAKLTGINRQQIYNDTDKLIKIGLLDITRKENKKFIAAQPQALLKVGKDQISSMEVTLSEVHKVIPDLENLSVPPKNKVLTKYFEGRDQIKRAYEMELEKSKNVTVYSLVGSVEDVFQFFPESYWTKWNKKFVAQGSSSKMLVHKSNSAAETTKFDKKYNRETRYLEKFPLKVNIDVIKDSVLIVSPHDDFAIWIESGILAESYKIMFKTMWSIAKKFED